MKGKTCIRSQGESGRVRLNSESEMVKQGRSIGLLMDTKHDLSGT
jgi:hypothetical protein